MSLCQYIFWVKEESFAEMKIMFRLTSFAIRQISIQASVDDERTLGKRQKNE